MAGATGGIAAWGIGATTVAGIGPVGTAKAGVERQQAVVGLAAKLRLAGASHRLVERLGL